MIGTSNMSDARSIESVECAKFPAEFSIHRRCISAKYHGTNEFSARDREDIEVDRISRSPEISNCPGPVPKVSQ